MAQTSSYSNYVIPEKDRVGRWSLTMAWWALFSAMFWIYVGVASAGAVGAVNTIIGMVLTVITFAVVNKILARRASQTGLSVSLWSRSLFGRIGSPLASLLLGVTAIYYAVFEGSIIAITFQKYFGGELKIWYLVVVLYALPLVLGGVQNWLDKLNGWLLPLYVGGLVAVVIAATVQQGYPSDWLTTTVAAGPLPGWVTSYLIYMGLWVMMMYTVDFARHGRKKDEKFHGTVAFGWVFYTFTFAINGLVGIYIMSAWKLPVSETGVVDAFISSLGFAGVLVIFISQTRINTANYYLASTNLGDFFASVAGRRVPRWVWVIVSGVVAYAFMLTGVIAYLLKALAWQGVFTTAWVAIAIVHILMTRKKTNELPEVRGEKLKPVSLGAIAWIVSSVVGIWLTEQTLAPILASLALPITVALAAGLYWLAAIVSSAPGIALDEIPESPLAIRISA